MTKLCLSRSRGNRGSIRRVCSLYEKGHEPCATRCGRRSGNHLRRRQQHRPAALGRLQCIAPSCDCICASSRSPAEVRAAVSERALPGSGRKVASRGSMRGGWRKQCSDASRRRARPPPQPCAAAIGHRDHGRDPALTRGITCRSLGIRELRFFPPLCARRGD